MWKRSRGSAQRKHGGGEGVRGTLMLRETEPRIVARKAWCQLIYHKCVTRTQTYPLNLCYQRHWGRGYWGVQTRVGSNVFLWTRKVAIWHKSKDCRMKKEFHVGCFPAKEKVKRLRPVASTQTWPLHFHCVLERKYRKVAKCYAQSRGQDLTWPGHWLPQFPRSCELKNFVQTKDFLYW